MHGVVQIRVFKFDLVQKSKHFRDIFLRVTLQTTGQRWRKVCRVRRIGSDCSSGDERSRLVVIQTDTAELVSQTATLRRPRALLPAIIAVNRLHGIFGRRARARRRTRACTPCAAARAQLPACRTPLLRHPLLRAAALKQNFGGSPLRTIPARGVELSAKKHESSLRCSGINSRGRPGGCCVVVTTHAVRHGDQKTKTSDSYPEIILWGC